MRRCKVGVLLCVLMVGEVVVVGVSGGRGGGRRAKGKGKNLLPFGNVAEYSLVSQTETHPLGAKILRGSHFNQIFRLGFKILLICLAQGTPRPDIKWYKDGSELYPRPNIHIYEKRIKENMIWNKVEIDPAVMGDQGVYTCMANNKYALMVKNFKCEYTY